MAKAKYYLSGGVFTGEQAERIAKNSSVGVQLSKKALNLWFQLTSPPVEQSVALEMLAFRHPDATQGVRAGTERRAPEFPCTLNAGLCRTARP